MEAATQFMEQVLATPVQECGEGMASLPAAVRSEGVEVVFSDAPFPGGFERQFYLRQGLIDSFIGVCRDMNQRGWLLKVDDAYRSVAMQTALGRDSDIFKRILEKVIWELNGRRPLAELIFRRLSVLIATRPKLGTHMSGSALDISVVERNSRTPVDRGGPYLELSEKTPMDSPFVSDLARKNRRAISALLSKWGFVAYPWEFWHYSKGDIYGVLLGDRDKRGEVARYGAIDFNAAGNTLTPILESVEPLHTFTDIEEEIDRVYRSRGRGTPHQG